MTRRASFVPIALVLITSFAGRMPPWSANYALLSVSIQREISGSDGPKGGAL